MTDGYLTAREAAEWLDTTEGTLAYWRSTNQGPPYVRLTDNPKGGIRYPIRDLRKYLEARTVRPGA